MFLDKWSNRNALLNSLSDAVQQGTHGLIRNLSVDRVDHENVVLRGSSHSYYGIQLAIHITKRFGEVHPVFRKTQLLLSVDGSTLHLVVTHSTNDETREPVSIPDVSCRPQLTTTGPA